jgi:TP901 family phage tail tape measure protein
MKQVAFEIVISDTQLKAQVAAVKKALASIKGAGVDIKLNVTKAEIETMRKKIRTVLASQPISVSIKGSDKLGANAQAFNKGIGNAVINMQKFLDLMQKAAAESRTIRNNIGTTSGVSGRSGSRINGGSRTGFTDSSGATLSAFSGFIRGGNSFTSQIGAVASGVGRLGLAAAAPVLIAATAVKGLRDAVGDITAFGDKQAELASILGTTRDGITSLTEQAKILGAAMSFTAVEITGAQIELAKLGFTANEIESSAEGVARFAIVAGANIPDAAEAAGAALQSFGLDAAEMDRVVSVLGVSTAKSALDFEKLKVGIGTTFATAKTFGLEIEDVTALLGELSNKGLSASVSATATRNILLNLADGEGKLRKTLANLGVKEVRGLDGIVTALRKLNAQGIDLATTFELTDKRSVNAFNSFLRGTDSLVNMRNSLTNVNDQFKIMEKERLNSLKGETILFASAMERLNLTITDGLEPALQGGLSALNGFINAISDLFEVPFEEGIENQRKGFERLMNVLIEGNVPFSVRQRIIAEMNIKYPEFLKNIKLEELSTQQLIDKLAEVNELYRVKKDFSVGESAVAKQLQVEQVLLDKQIESFEKRNKLLFQISKRDEILSKPKGERTKQDNLELIQLIQAIGSNEKDINRKLAEADASSAALDKQRSIVARDLRKQFQKTGDVTLDDFSVLQNYRKLYQGGDQGAGLDQSLLLLFQIEQKQREIKASVPLFDKKDFKAGVDGLSEVDKFLNSIDDKLETIEKSGRGSGVEAKTLRDVRKELQDRQLLIRQGFGKVEVIGGRKSGDKKDKESPLPDSIDFLEAEYSRLVKEIDKVGDASLRPTLQKQAEVFKKRVKEARDKLKADLEPTDDEKIKLFNTLVDNQRDIDSQANKERFKDERVREAVELEQVKQSELRKIFFRGQFQKKAFDAGLDKSGEYLKAQQEFANKLVELEEATGKRVLAVGEVSREMEVKDRLVILRAIYKDEEDFAKAKESLFLELEVKQLQSLKTLTLAQEEQLNGLLLKIKNINSELAISNLSKSLSFTSDSNFNNVFEGLNKGGLSKREIEELDKLERKSEFERESAILRERILRATTQEDQVKFQKELNKLIIGNQKQEYEDKKKKQEDIWNTVRQGADIASQISDKIFEYERTQLEAKSESELETIDTIYAARLKAAEGNQSETERIEQEYQLKKTAAEKKAAEARKQIALKEASINLALGVLKAIPDLLLMGVAAVTGAIQIATIRNQKFAKGGYTGNSIGAKDETGHVPVGIVHDGEYVVPKWQVRKRPSLIASLEKDRLRGYAVGGLASAQSSGGVSLESFAMMADIIAERVAASVGAAAYQGTSMGSEKGSVSGIVKVSRENNSRNNAKLINTF